MKKTLLLIVSVWSILPAMARMPLPLLDQEGMEERSAIPWRPVMSMLGSELACRQQPDLGHPLLRPFIFGKNSRRQLFPPSGFVLFGLPIRTVTIETGTRGEAIRYTTSVFASMKVAMKAANIKKQKRTKLGD